MRNHQRVTVWIVNAELASRRVKRVTNRPDFHAFALKLSPVRGHIRRVHIKQNILCPGVHRTARTRKHQIRSTASEPCPLRLPVAFHGFFHLKAEQLVKLNRFFNIRHVRQWH